MREVNVTLAAIHTLALDSALRAVLPGKTIGVSTYGPERPVSIWLEDSAAESEMTTAEALAAAHDPVFLTVDKTHIAADGVDTATITVSASQSGAPVTLVVAGTPVSVTFINGIGTVTITSADPATIPVSVQDPANRTTDSYSIEAM